MNALTYNDKIFAAGFFEGAGCISKCRIGRRVDGRLMFSSKRRGSLERLQSMLGIGRLSGPHTNTSGGTFWRLAITPKHDIADFVETVGPYLSSERQQYIRDKLEGTKNWGSRGPRKSIII